MPTKEEAAQSLAVMHYEVEPGLTHVFRIAGTADMEFNPAEPIKLLEVNEHTVPSGILPIQFGPSPAAGLHYSSVIVEVTPEEFSLIEAKKLPLPHGWQVGELIPRPPAEAG